MVMVPVRKQTSPLLGPSKKWVLFSTLWLALATAGCDAASSRPSIPNGDVRTEKLKTNISPEEARDIAQPLSATPGLSVETTAAQSGAIGNEAYNSQMNPAMGIKTKRLFDTRADSDDERFERLEAAVQALRDDFDKASPSINRLMAIEQEIQTLVDQLQSLVGDTGAGAADVPIPPVSAQLLEDETAEPTTLPPLPPDAQAMQDAGQATPVTAAPAPPQAPVPLTPDTATFAPAVAPPPAPAPATAPVVATPPPAPAPVPVAGGPALTGLRMGDHGTTARIVFETTKKIEYTASVDPEKILLVNFSAGTSNLSAAQLTPKSDIIKSVDVTPQNNGGFIVAMGLSKMTKIVRQGVLAPDAENPNYRIYIDIER